MFFGDMGGNFYALDAANGQKLWGQKIGGAIGGGVITYTVNGSQKVAAATGLTEILWPTEITHRKGLNLGPRRAPRRTNEAAMELDPVFLRASSSASSSAFTSSSRPSRSAWRRGWRRSRARGSPPAMRSTGACSISGSRSSRSRSAWASSPASSWRSSSAPTGACWRRRPARSRGRCSATKPSPPSCWRRRFFGVMLLGRDRVSPRFYFFACCMVSLGTMFSSFWILANNSWMQVPRRPHDRRRQDHPRGLVDDHDRAGHDGALAAHAARRVPDDRHVRGGDRRLVCAAQHSSRRGARDAELGARARRGADSDPALLRPPDRPLCAQASAGEVRGDRGALEDAAAGERGADRDSRRGARAQPVCDRDPEARQLHRLGQLDRARDRARSLSRAKTGRRW